MDRDPEDPERVGAARGEALGESQRVGLCAVCVHARVVRGARSTFYLCARSASDARYPKYPRLPMLACAGFERENVVG